jgi:hypothetical protein
VLDKLQTITVSDDGTVVSDAAGGPDTILSSFDNNRARKIMNNYSAIPL